MIVVADTNVMVSALLWSGPPHRLLRSAEDGRVTLYASPPLLRELAGVLARQKFSARLKELRTSVDELVAGYAQLTHLVWPHAIPPVILQDPSDDVILATAQTAKASHIVSGDPHLLKLRYFEGIQIVSPRYFLDHKLTRSSK